MADKQEYIEQPKVPGWYRVQSQGLYPVGKPPERIYEIVEDDGKLYLDHPMHGMFDLEKCNYLYAGPLPSVSISAEDLETLLDLANQSVDWMKDEPRRKEKYLEAMTVIRLGYHLVNVALDGQEETANSTPN